jgi:serine/threonine protein kinase
MHAVEPVQMSSKLRCPKCDAALSNDAVKGLCPRCLMAAGVEESRVEESSSLAKELNEEERVGGRIGRYKILQELGEGGCGVVYMAEQTELVRRRVALKIIKRGMDTKQVIARFEAERQTLALMDHPNVAKVLDAGTTDNGRPYFVMELVKGIRITEYCDKNHLTTAERLVLFTQVCQAIQHAHQKGIIHRDIKPSNILVTLHDGTPVPKVIDFGIAKATERPLTEKTVFTAFGQFMGTPAYMSPEQAELSGLDIDTRSDIYALGVLLYELITGRTPFDGKELSEAGLDEMRRRIREEEPMRPSTRLSTMADADLALVSQQRKSEPVKLTRFIRGDLDWIVMKCLEKDRTRRYETANGLAVDIRRHLANEPVVACPPSAVYRFQKLVRRNKLGVASVAAVAAALLVGFGVSTWLWLQARASEARSRKMLNYFTATQIDRTEPPQSFRRFLENSSHGNAFVVRAPGDPRLMGKTHEEWAVALWEWGLAIPLTNAAGIVHPWISSTSTRFDISQGQKGDVWFLGAPFGTTRRICRIPAGKSLFVQVFGVEASDIEAPPFYAAKDDQRFKAQEWADHIVDPFCEIDHVLLPDMEGHRLQCGPFAFTAPTPWIQGDIGGKGTAAGDGYFVFLAPLRAGQHTIRFGGRVFFSTRKNDAIDLDQAIDVTYVITVAESEQQRTSGELNAKE